MTIMTQLSSLVGALNKPTLEAKPTDLEIALARVNADHKSVLVAVKMLTEIAQSTAAANLNMTVVHEERHKDTLKNMRELKKEMMHSDNRHLAAFELAMRPVLRAIDLLTQNIDKVNAVFVDKMNNIDGDINDLRAEIYADREAQARIQNTKLNAIAERLDTLITILANDLIKHPKGVTGAPPKPKKKQGRRTGDKNRTFEERYKFLSHRLQVARPDSKARVKYLIQLTKLREKMGMAPMSDRALGKAAE
jgi:hypothetical protein